MYVIYTFISVLASNKVECNMKLQQKISFQFGKMCLLSPNRSFDFWKGFQSFS